MEQVFYNRSEFRKALRRAQENETYVKHSERRVFTRKPSPLAPRYKFTLQTKG